MQLLMQSGDLGPSWFHVALRALVLLAKSEALLKSNDIAERLGAEASYVRRILARLSKMGIVSSICGRDGGYALSKPANQITVGEVYRVLGTGTKSSVSSVPSTGVEQFISMVISRAEREFQSFLDAYTMEDIIEQGWNLTRSTHTEK